jgi:hypothetical protein
MSPPSAWPRELAAEAKRTLLAMPVALDDAVSAGDFPGKLLDSREGIYVASLLVAALVPFVRRAFVELVAEVSGGKEREREKEKERGRWWMIGEIDAPFRCSPLCRRSLSTSQNLRPRPFSSPHPHQTTQPALCQALPAGLQAPARGRDQTVQALQVERYELDLI